MLRAVLNRQFVQAVRASGLNQTVLATLAGYAANSQLSATLAARSIAATPKAIARLERLREVIGFDGPLWEGRVRRG